MELLLLVCLLFYVYFDMFVYVDLMLVSGLIDSAVMCLCNV